MATAYAEIGRLPAAVEISEMALGAERRSGEDSLAGRIERRMRMYDAGEAVSGRRALGVRIHLIKGTILALRRDS